MAGTEDREWGILLKVRIEPTSPALDQTGLDRLLAALPGKDKKLTGSGRDFTVAWWVEAADAVIATKSGADTLRAAARSEGLPELIVVRSHAASVEGRASAVLGADSHLDHVGDWAIDFKAAAPPGGDPATPELLERVRQAMGRPDVSVTLRGDPEKFLLDDGSGFTVRFWASGDTQAQAFRAARRDILATLERAGLDDWALVRLKAGTPNFVYGEGFPGADTREPAPTGELR